MFSANSSQVSDEKLYVEDVFSTYLFNGQGGATDYNVINGIDLAGKGGLVWSKYRTTTASNWFIDTARGALQAIAADTTDAQFTAFQNMTTGFLSNGFTFRDSASGFPLASWTFRKAPKFFDVVTYTGNGANRNIAHNLGVAPGCIIVKRTDAAADWQVYHRSNANTEYMVLNSTDAKSTGTTRWNSTTPTATEFTVGTDTTVNASGGTYVAYLFAHDTTADGIIQCGSFTSHASGGTVSVNLGWEPQWILLRNAQDAANWFIYDTMRGWVNGTGDNRLLPNQNGAEGVTEVGNPTATGFNASNLDWSNTYIYIAIRRGPMRTPTSGTSVFGVNTATQAINSSTRPPAVSFITDMAMYRGRSGVLDWAEVDRLRGPNWLVTNYVGAEASGINAKFDTMTGWYPDVNPWEPSGSYLFYNFRRAPSFFDEVCYTGTGANLTVSHNLGVVPELMIIKSRSAVSDWQVYSANLANTEYLVLNTTAAKATGTTRWNSTTPSATTFTVGTAAAVNTNASTYVAYLFASCPGVSKVFSFTGNGGSQTINCGFSGGARFVMIKRTDSTGDWWVWDTARGLVSGNDPALRLNSTAAETTGIDSIDPDSSGFIVNQDATTNINVNSASYIGIAIS